MTRFARASIRRLRSGVVPIDDLDALSVGYDDVRAMVEDSFTALRLKGRCAPLFVRGEWGTGKSHLLEFIRGAAIGHGIAHVRVDLNARGAPLNYPQRFYPWIVESICLKQARGLRTIVEDAFAHRERRDGLLRYAWAAESGPLGAALRSIVLASREIGDEVLVDHPAWDVVLGADLAPFDHKRTKTLERLAAVARLLRSVGGAGLVIVLDEAETIDQLWNRLSRLGAFETLGAICKMDAAWAVFGVTARFERSVNRDLDHGLLRYAPTEHATSFLRAWRDGAFRQFQPPAMTDAHADSLATRVIEAYSAAYPTGAEHSASGLEALRTWKANPGRNPRRLIRCIIDALDSRRQLQINAAEILG